MNQRRPLRNLLVALGASLVSVNASAQLAPPVGATGAVQSGEQSGFHVYAGVRTWINRWEVGFLETTPTIVNGAPALRSEIKQRTSGTEIVPMPTAGITYGPWSLSATYFPKTSYDAGGGFTDVDRKEYDINLGYAVLPSLTLSVGYKEAKQSRLSSQISPSGAKVRGVIVGLSGSAQLHNRLSLYGNFAYGWANEKTDFPDARGETKFDGDYQIGELGLSYSLGSFGQFLQNIVISAGYRFQVFTARGIATATTTAAPPFTVLSTDERKVRTYTTGPTVALIAFF